MIQIKEMENIQCDSNEKIKQLRWDKKKLISYKHYLSFTDTELLLLFESMKEVLGENVILQFR